MRKFRYATTNSQSNYVPSFFKHSMYLLVFILALTFFNVFKAHINQLSLSKIDPVLFSILKHKNTTIAYITFKNNLNIYCLKKWKFGKVIICKSLVTKNQILNLSKLKNVLSIWSVYQFNFTNPFVVKTQSLSYNIYPNVYYKTMLINSESEYNGNITVLIIDTGIDYLSPCFYKNNKTVIKALVSCVDYINGSCIVNNTTNFTYSQMYNVYLFEKNVTVQTGIYPYLDLAGHGTFVSGEITSQCPYANGLASNDKIIMVKAFWKNGTGSYDNILNALQWAYNNIPIYNIKAMSLSWGSTSSSLNDPIVIALKQIYNKYHIAIFVANGNSGNFPGDVCSPAIAQFVFSVGAWNCYNNKLAWYSSIGPTRYGYLKPNGVACGSYIIGIRSEFAINLPKWDNNALYTIMSGTSMSTPLATACYSRFYQYYLEKYHKTPTLKEFEKYEEVNAIKYYYTNDFISGVGLLQCP